MNRAWMDALRTNGKYEKGVEEFIEFSKRNAPSKKQDSQGSFTPEGPRMDILARARLSRVIHTRGSQNGHSSNGIRET